MPRIRKRCGHGRWIGEAFGHLLHHHLGQHARGHVGLDLARRVEVQGRIHLPTRKHPRGLEQLVCPLGNGDGERCFAVLDAVARLRVADLGDGERALLAHGLHQGAHSRPAVLVNHQQIDALCLAFRCKHGAEQDREQHGQQHGHHRPLPVGRELHQLLTYQPKAVKLP